MPNLPTVAARLNDIEISANAPVTETLNRKYGSNINLLLDALNITDGTTSVGGTGVGDLFNAVQIIGSHTMDLQVTVIGTQTNLVVGTFPRIPFLNNVFYLINPGSGIVITPHDPVAGTRVTFSASYDSGPDQGILVPPTLLLPDPVAATDAEDISNSQSSIIGDSANAVRRGSRGHNFGEITLAAGEVVMAVELDWRDCATDIQLKVSNANPATNFEVHRGYRLTAESLPF